MPTAAEFRAAAARFRSLGDTAATHARTVAAWPLARHLGPGPAHDVAAASLRTVEGHLTAAAAALDALAGLCDARAAVCDDYHRLLAAHAALEPAVRAATTPPLPASGWVR